MSDNLQKYLPEYDPDEARARLTKFSKEDLIDMLVRAYMEKRVLAKMLDERMNKLSRVETILEEPSSLLNMPDIPTVEDLRRMLDLNDE